MVRARTGFPLATGLQRLVGKTATQVTAERRVGPVSCRSDVPPPTAATDADADLPSHCGLCPCGDQRKVRGPSKVPDELTPGRSDGGPASWVVV